MFLTMCHGRLLRNVTTLRNLRNLPGRLEENAWFYRIYCTGTALSLRGIDIYLYITRNRAWLERIYCTGTVLSLRGIDIFQQLPYKPMSRLRFSHPFSANTVQTTVTA